MVSSLQLSWCFYYDWYLPCGLNNADNEDKDKQNTNQPLLLDIIQLMTFDEVNTRIDQPMEHDIHRGSRGEYHVPWVDQSLYSPKWKVINCFII